MYHCPTNYLFKEPTSNLAGNKLADKLYACLSAVRIKFSLMAQSASIVFTSFMLNIGLKSTINVHFYVVKVFYSGIFYDYDV